MRDFRAANDDSGEIVPRPFYYPRTVRPAYRNSDIINAFLIIPLISSLFRFFGRLSPVCYRSGRLFPGMALGSSVLGWGKLMAIALTAVLLTSPELLDRYAPHWRENIGYFALGFAGVALIATVFRFCGGVAKCALWVFVLVSISRAMGPGTAPSDYNTRIVGSAPLQSEHEEWVDLFNGHPIALPKRNLLAVSYPEVQVRNSAETSSWNPLELLSRFGSSAQQGLRDSANDVLAQLSGSVLNVGIPVSRGSRSAVPDSAYFAAPFRPQQAMIPSSSGSRSGFPQVDALIQRFTGMQR